VRRDRQGEYEAHEEDAHQAIAGVM
jgi:hypothetical protein